MPLLLAPPFSQLVIVSILMILTLRKPLASQGLFVALLDLNITSLQLQRTRESAAGPHSGKVLGCVDCEHVTQHFGQNLRETSDMELRRVETH